MSSKFQSALLVGIAIGIVLLFLRNKPEPERPIIQDIRITQAEDRSVTVVGTGEIKVEPDIVKFDINIHSTNKDLEPAKQETEDVLSKITDILEKNKISASDFDIDFIRISTESAAQKIYSYTVSRTIRVTLRDMTLMEPVFTDVLELRIVEIKNVSFQVSSLEFYQSQALRKAIQSASEKAEIMANEAGKKIGETLTINEESLKYNDVRYPDVIQMNGLYLDYLFDNLTALAFSEVVIVANVTVSYEIK